MEKELVLGQKKFGIKNNLKIITLERKKEFLDILIRIMWFNEKIQEQIQELIEN